MSRRDMYPWHWIVAIAVLWVAAFAAWLGCSGGRLPGYDERNFGPCPKVEGATGEVQGDYYHIYRCEDGSLIFTPMETKPSPVLDRG